MTRTLIRLLAGAIAVFILTITPTPASAEGGLVDISLERTPGGLLSPRLPAAPRQATSEPPGGGVCVGLKDYEIVRSPTEVAQCSAGNMVLGGSCPTSLAPIQGPSLDGTAWECLQGPSIAICANVCSELPPAMGACCTGADCSISTAEECGAAGGEYQGDGTTCDDETCLLPGACCLGPGECLELTELECADSGGEYFGDGIQCDDDEAASCFEDPLGACCLPDEPCCLDDQTEEDCIQLGGSFLGPGTSCEVDGETCFDGCPPAPVGACCIGLECEDGLTQAECEDGGGDYLGNGSTCGPDSCAPPPPIGACCLPDEPCCLNDQTEDDCIQVGGTFLGPNTFCFLQGEVCFDGCPPAPIGACCFGFECEEITEAECQDDGGEYLGDDTTCEDNCLPIGACCIIQTCNEDFTEAECEEAGGEYQGDNSNCGPESCPPPLELGACCVADNECVDGVSHAACTGMGLGIWLGPDTVCAPGVCDLPQPIRPPNRGERGGNRRFPRP